MNLSELMAKHAETRFEIIARDPDKQLEKLLEKIKGHAAPGHTFDVVVDPSMTKEEGKESFCMDGDGSFRIYGIDKKNIEPTEKKDGEYKTPKAVFGGHDYWKKAELNINTLEKIAATRWAKEMIKAGDNIVAGKNQAKNVNTFNNIMQNVVDKDSISPSTLVALKKGIKPADTKGVVQFSIAKGKGNKGILAQQVRPATKDSLVPQSDKLKEKLPRATALHKANSLDDILSAYKEPVVRKNSITETDNGGLLRTPASALKYFGNSLFGLL